MKKIIYILLTLFIVSCADKLNIDPTTSISSDQAKKSVDLLVIGAYAMIGSGPGTTGPNAQEGALYSTDFLLNADLLASEDYMNWRGTFDQYKEVSTKLMSATNSTTTRMWVKAFAAINLANTILVSLPNAPEADRDRFKGHALFIRGILQFDLLRFFGEPAKDLGIPIVTQPTENFSTGNTPGRMSIADSYAAIKADLTQAKALLPEDDDVFADRYVAAAVLARVYLTTGEYDKALAEADEVIESGKYSLSASVEDAFNTDGSPESIFEIQQTTINNAGTANDGLTTFYSCDTNTPGNTGRGDVGIDQNFIDLYEPTDKRGELLLIYTGDCSRSSVTSGKWRDPYANIPIIRLSEMYLIRAESNERLGSNVGDTPLNDINAIRDKAGASDLSSVDLPAILLERQLELAFEGQRIHDFKRLNTPVTTVGGETINYNDPQFVLPIPQIEINTNKAMVQNSYYH